MNVNGSLDIVVVKYLASALDILDTVALPPIDVRFYLIEHVSN